MNRALIYLWLVLLKRKTFHFLRGLRHPTTLIGIGSLVFFVGFLFFHRQAEVFGQLVRREILIGGALLMLGGSLFKGFLQRGLVFEPPDVQFLFTSPFTQRQIVFYRLLPSYLFAVAQGAVFFGLFASHLKHPLLTTLCLILFQMACFHLAAGAAIYAGTISEQAHHRIRWMMLAVYFFITALYLRTAWGLKLIPAFASSSLAQLLFYPAVNLSDVGTEPLFRGWSLHLLSAGSVSAQNFWQPALYLCAFALSALASLGLLLRLKGNIFETSLATTSRAAEKRLRVRQGRSLAVIEDKPLRSARLPNLAIFHGVGAIIWKNLVVAVRSKREVVLASVFTLIYTGFLVALRYVLHHQMAEGGELPARDIRDFDNGLVSMLCCLAFLLQRAFPFDFRRDGQHLVGFRTLPVSPFALTLAELAVPTILCLAFQFLGMIVLMISSRFDLLPAIVMLLGFPAVALALNGVWNLHYLLAASKRAGGKPESASPVALLMVVALSFLIFYPAGWAALMVGKHFYGRFAEPLAVATWLALQYAVDFLLVLILARMFQRFEVSRDSS
jgi:hypothetical protein